MYQRNKKITSYFIFFGLLLIGVVYAILQANLQINGTAKIKSNTWDIHFDNIQVNENSVSIGTGDSAAVIDPNNNCKIDFEVTLSLPGDFYEFTVDVVNAGTIDAMIGTLNQTQKVNNEIVSEVPNYLNYSVTYEDGVEILPNHLLSAGNTETYLVRVEFRSDIEELPEATTVVTTLEPQYIQADNTAIPIIHTQPKVPVTDTIYWALQDNNNDGDYEKLVISDSEVTGSDNYQGSFAGTTVFTNYADVPWILLSSDYGGISHKVEEIKIEGIVAPTSTAYWFRGAGADSQTLEGNLNNLNVSNVTNMQEMFSYVGFDATTFELDLSGWNTSNVTNMSYMFSSAGANATTWSIGDLSNWDTSKVTNMSYMFSSVGRNAATFNIDLSNWDTSQVTSMGSMFSYAGYNATTFELDLSNWNTSKVTDMSDMFDYTGHNATTFNLDLSSFDTSNVTNMQAMFGYAGYNATTWNIGDLSNWNTSNVTSMSGMFSYAGYNARTFELNLSGWNTSNVTKMNNMFSYAGENATTFELNLSGWNTSNVTKMYSMFEYAGYSATTWSIGDLSTWDTSKVTDMSSMFEYAGYNATTWNSIGSLKVYATDISDMFYVSKNAKATLKIYNKPTSYRRAFSNAAIVSGSGITVDYTSAVTNIDNIIATKSSNSNVVKGSLFTP